MSKKISLQHIGFFGYYLRLRDQEAKAFYDKCDLNSTEIMDWVIAMRKKAFLEMAGSIAKQNFLDALEYLIVSDSVEENWQWVAVSHRLPLSEIVDKKGFILKTFRALAEREPNYVFNMTDVEIDNSLTPVALLEGWHKMELDHDKEYSMDELEACLLSEDKSLVTDALLGICFNGDDPEFIQDKCVQMIKTNKDLDVINLALTCIGHVARMHLQINRDKVFPILNEMLKDSRRNVKGTALDALSDIQIFLHINRRDFRRWLAAHGIQYALVNPPRKLKKSDKKSVIHGAMSNDLFYKQTHGLAKMIDIEFDERFLLLTKEMENFYSLNFASNEEEYKKNREVKYKIIGFVRDALRIKNDEMARKGLMLMIENTGCKEDFEIFLDLIHPLVYEGLFQQDSLQDMLKELPLARWL